MTRRTLAALLASALVACTSEPSVPVADVTVTPAGTRLLVDSSVTLLATPYNAEGGALTGRLPVWSSRDPAIATVTADGVARGVAPGTVQVDATVETRVGTARITVLAPVVAMLLHPDTTSVLTGDSVYLTAEPHDAAGEWLGDRTVAWRSLDTTRAVVSARGVVRGIRPGTARIVAEVELKADTSMVTVLAPVVSAQLALDSLPIWIGDSTQLAVTLRDSAGNVVAGRPLTWSVTGTPGIGVSADGVVRAAVGGVATVTVAVEGRADSLPVVSRMEGAATAVATGDTYTCAVTAAGRAYCWGLGLYGELGGPGTATTPARVLGVPALAGISAEFDHVCGWTSGGTAWCWGGNRNGQTGTLTGSMLCAYGEPCRAVPLPIDDTLQFALVSAGNRTTCGVTPTAEAWCWGSNAYGALGGGTSDLTPHVAAVRVAGGLSAAHIAVGASLACGLTPAGAAWCWGYNAYGGVGDSTNTSRVVPVPVHGGHVFVHLDVTAGEACGVDAAGAAWCWGGGALSTYPVLSGVGAPPLVRVVQAWIHTCALATDGQAWCWGDNQFGQLGNGTTGGNSGTAVLTSGGLRFSTISAGPYHTCAIASGRVYCWGEGSMGELGTGAGIASVPTLVYGQP